MILANVFAWFVQTTLLTTVVLLSGRALRVRHARLEMFVLQCVLAATIVLPWAQPWVQPPAQLPVFHSVATPTRIDTNVSQPLVAPVPGTRISLETVMLVLFIAGVGLRATWLLLGTIRLQAYLRTGAPLSSDIAAEELTGAAAEFRLSPEIASPVTFGLWRPVVLVPPMFLEMPAAQRHAVACHELLHVRRRDWLACMAEEAALTIMWFHPGVWFLIRRVRTLRERVVDANAVALTRDRQQYVEALLAFATSPGGMRAATANPFVRKRDLLDRVSSLMEENAMSKARLLTCASLMGACAFIAAVISVSTFPLVGAPRSIPGAVSRVDLHGIPAEILPQVEKVAGTLKGQAFDAELMARVKAQLQSVDPKLVPHWLEETPGVVSLSIGHLGERSSATTVVKAIDPSRLPENLRTRVHEALLSFLDQPFSEAVMDGVNSVVASIDRKIAVRWGFHSGGAALSLILAYDLPEGAWQPIFGVLSRVDTSRLSSQVRARVDSILAKHMGRPLTNATLHRIGLELQASQPGVDLSWKLGSADGPSLTVVERIQGQGLRAR